mmetsp:Transcript_16262/g.39953  ORF Transcript_16262/g.39953 Transcript_16262/m.39953 type:complete len:240 (+) Transcript_16262:151-870(+)
MVFIQVARFLQANVFTTSPRLRLDAQSLQLLAVVVALAVRLTGLTLPTRGTLYDVSALLQCVALCTAAAHLGDRGQGGQVSQRHALAAGGGAVLRIAAQPSLAWEDLAPQIAVACLSALVVMITPTEEGTEEAGPSRAMAAVTVLSCAFPGTLRFRVAADVVTAVGGVAMIAAARRGESALPVAACAWALLSQLAAMVATLALGGWLGVLACALQAIPAALALKDWGAHMIKVLELRFP